MDRFKKNLSAFAPLLSLFFLLASSASAYSSETYRLTLADCLLRGKTENAALKSKGLEVDEATEGVRGAWGAFLPTLSLNYTNTQLHNNSSSESDRDYLDQRNTGTSASLVQPLFTGFAGVSGLKRAELELEYRKQEKLLAWLKLSRDIRRDFHAVLFGDELVRLLDDSLERLKRLQEVTRAWYDRQMINKVQLLEVEVELSDALQQRQDAISNLTTARARLSRWLAISGAETFALVGSLTPAEDGSFPSLSQCLSLSLSARPELKMAQLGIAMAEQDVRGTMARSLPQASLELAWNSSEQDYDQNSPDEDRTYYTVGFNVSMTLFDGGRNISAVRQRQIAVEKMRQQSIDARENVETEVRTYFTQWQGTAAMVHSAAEALNLAETAWHLANQALDLGVGSQRDSLEAGLRLTRAEIGHLRALFNQSIRFADLHYALGRSD